MSVRQQTCRPATCLEGLKHRGFPLVLGLCLAPTVFAATPLGAQAKRQITACVVREGPGGESLSSSPSLPLMITAIGGGQVVRQTETMFPAGQFRACAGLTDLAPGAYDLRVEAAGMRTEAKRGIRLFADQNSSLNFVVNPGSGLRIVEYAQGALAREEVAARLVALEGAVAKIQAAGGAVATPGKAVPSAAKP